MKGKHFSQLCFHPQGHQHQIMFLNLFAAHVFQKSLAIPVDVDVWQPIWLVLCFVTVKEAPLFVTMNTLGHQKNQMRKNYHTSIIKKNCYKKFRVFIFRNSVLMGCENINVRAYRKSCRKLSQIECPSTEKCPLLTQGQQVEMCYMSLEQSETAFKKTMDFNCEPQLKFCRTIGF